eukprot:29255-Pelagococcus_subviridis.AAC.1
MVSASGNFHRVLFAIASRRRLVSSRLRLALPASASHRLERVARHVVVLLYSSSSLFRRVLRAAPRAIVRRVTRFDPRARRTSAAEVRSIHWFPYDPVGVVNADP